MNDKFYTQTGTRDDLAKAININAPEGYIGSKIIPTLEVYDKSGTIYYMDVDDMGNEAAETGRVAGVAPDKTVLASNSASFTCAERIKRAVVTPDEAKQMGGVEQADRVGVAWAAKQVLNAIETDIAALILADPDAEFHAPLLLVQVQTALDQMKLVEGKTALVGSTMVIKRICQALGDKINRIVTGNNPELAKGGLSFEAQKYALAVFLGVDEVFAGDSSIWNAGDNAERFAVVKFDDSGDTLSHKYMPVLGKLAMFIPDPASPNSYVVRSAADPVAVRNIYDAASWYDIEIFNPQGKYVWEDAAETRSSSSSSSSSSSEDYSGSSDSSSTGSSLSTESSESSSSGV
jgi:hypothetical protein